MSSGINQPSSSHKRKGGRAPLAEVEENYTRLPPGPGDRTERAVCKHCSKERSWHTTELVKHLDKCVQYTPSKRQKYTRPWRIERPHSSRQSQPQSPPPPQNAALDVTDRNTAMFRCHVAARRSTISGRADGDAEDDEPQPQSRPAPSNHRTLHTPSQSLGGNTDFATTPMTTNTPMMNQTPVSNITNRSSLNQPQQTPPQQQQTSQQPMPVNDPDQRLRGFIEYERGAMAWQTRPGDLDAIEAWLQHHRFDIEDIKEITDTRWTDSWQLKLGDLYRIKRDVQTFKIFAAR
jgi:hypothetical protein